MKSLCKVISQQMCNFLPRLISTAGTYPTCCYTSHAQANLNRPPTTLFHLQARTNHYTFMIIPLFSHSVFCLREQAARPCGGLQKEIAMKGTAPVSFIETAPCAVDISSMSRGACTPTASSRNLLKLLDNSRRDRCYCGSFGKRPHRLSVVVGRGDVGGVFSSRSAPLRQAGWRAATDTLNSNYGGGS